MPEGDKKETSKLFDRWQSQIVRPVLVSVLTAGVLFGLAALFKPVIWYIFSPDVTKEYPLICRAEPYRDTGQSLRELNVDFFIINLSKDEKKEMDLRRILRNNNPQNPNLTPEIRLILKPSITLNKIKTEKQEKENAVFNADKGEITANFGTPGEIQINIKSIKSYAVWKLTFVFDGAIPTKISRQAFFTKVPFYIADIIDTRCYQRSGLLSRFMEIGDATSLSSGKSFSNRPSEVKRF